jgi:ferredoxin
VCRRVENVLAAALAAGIPMPHSCRAGRCASCKSRLVVRRDRISGGSAAGHHAGGIERGDVLLCQARPRSDLPSNRAYAAARCPHRARRLVASHSCHSLPLRVQLRIREWPVRDAAGQFVELRNPAGDAERLAVIGTGERPSTSSRRRMAAPCAQWLEGDPGAGTAGASSPARSIGRVRSGNGP